MQPFVAAAIFDMDGTLVDSLEGLADSVNIALEAYLLPTHPVAAYKYFVGMGLKNMIASALPEGTPETVAAKVMARWRVEYERCWRTKGWPYEGVPEMLDSLSRQGVPMAVLSNKPQDFIREFTRHFFPGVAFVAVAGSPEGGRAKPNPAMALDIASRMGLPPEVTAFIGDSRTDMETAVNAGMLPVGVTWGFRPESELVRYGARVLLHAPGDLFERIRLAE